MDNKITADLLGKAVRVGDRLLLITDYGLCERDVLDINLTLRGIQLLEKYYKFTQKVWYSFDDFGSGKRFVALAILHSKEKNTFCCHDYKEYKIGEEVCVRDRLNPVGLIKGEIDMINTRTGEVRVFTSEGGLFWTNDRYTIVEDEQGQ